MQVLSEIEKKFAESERNVHQNGQPCWEGGGAGAALPRQPHSNTLDLERPQGAQQVQGRLRTAVSSGRGGPAEGDGRGIADLRPSMGNGGGDCFHAPRQDCAPSREADSYSKTGESANDSMSTAFRESVFSAQMSEGVCDYAAFCIIFIVHVHLAHAHSSIALPDEFDNLFSNLGEVNFDFLS